MSIRLSKSALEKFRSCARCFWLDKVQGLKQPEGIRSGLPMGMDRVLKGHYDAHREAGKLPPELVGHVPGGLYDGKRISMKDLRNWRKGLSVTVEDGGFQAELSTALDDLLFDPATGRYAMIDYKTKAKATDQAATQLYYGTQADCYDLALNANGYATWDVAYFAYYYPVNVGADGSGIAEGGHQGVAMGWACQVVPIKPDHARAKALLIAAARCLEGKIPEAGEDCDYCAFVVARTNQAEPVKA